MTYRVLEGAEEQKVIDAVKARLPELAKIGDISRWEKGWGENLAAYKASGDPRDLRPKYIRESLPLRRYGRFIVCDDPDTEMKWYEGLREQVASAWLADSKYIFEYGSGSAHNLAWLKKRFPEAKLVGLDWSWAAVELAQRVGAVGERFDFFDPVVPNFPAKSAALTIGALEQTGLRWKAFISELVEAKPAICVHIEPMMEWYDPSNPVDATAIAVQARKGFWVGFWPWLKARRREGKVEILEARRSGHGSMMIEGYNVIVWRPI